ncbi:hypothetical protein [Streptomyces sp. URMC 129]|uniref:hypothetical protein n=1 Tax=Streptomyces sp. URMC 129 TaxID=3423407 RepID=UPI003F1CD87C
MTMHLPRRTTRPARPGVNITAVTAITALVPQAATVLITPVWYQGRRLRRVLMRDAHGRECGTVAAARVALRRLAAGAARDPRHGRSRGAAASPRPRRPGSDRRRGGRVIALALAALSLAALAVVKVRVDAIWNSPGSYAITHTPKGTGR